MDTGTVHALRARAEAAIERDMTQIAGGWSPRPRAGRAHVAGLFEYEKTRWVAVRGVQRPDTPRLLDAALGFMFAEGAQRALTILDRPAEPYGSLSPSPEYVRRLRTLLWEGLGVLWLTADASERVTFDPLDRTEQKARLERAFAEAENAVRAAADASWAELNDRPSARDAVLPPVEQALGKQSFAPAASRQYVGFWRRGEVDGVWQGRDDARPGSSGPTLSVEVFARDRVDTPFGPVVDALGAFDGAISVRLLASEEDRRRLRHIMGIAAAAERVEGTLPVRMITLRFCSSCKAPLSEPALDWPNVVCGRCADLAREDSRSGDPKVSLEGRSGWRRTTQEGATVTMLDPDGHESVDEFLRAHRAPS